MPDIIADPPAPAVILLFRDRESRNLNRLILIFPVSRAARGRVAKGRSGKPRGLTGRD